MILLDHMKSELRAFVWEIILSVLILTADLGMMILSTSFTGLSNDISPVPAYLSAAGHHVKRNCS